MKPAIKFYSMNLGDKVQVTNDFWVTKFETDLIHITVEMGMDINPTAVLPRCIPELSVYPSWMDFQVPETDLLRDGLSFYKLRVPEDFRLSGGRYFYKGIREKIECFAELKGEFERDKPMGNWLNLRMNGRLISGKIIRLYKTAPNKEIVYLQTAEEGSIAVVHEPSTAIEYHIRTSLLKCV